MFLMGYFLSSSLAKRHGKSTTPILQSRCNDIKKGQQKICVCAKKQVPRNSFVALAASQADPRRHPCSI